MLCMISCLLRISSGTSRIRSRIIPRPGMYLGSCPVIIAWIFCLLMLPFAIAPAASLVFNPQSIAALYAFRISLKDSSRAFSISCAPNSISPAEGVPLRFSSEERRLVDLAMSELNVTAFFASSSARLSF